MQLWSVEYEVNGELFAMHICGSYEEAITHADMLGLSEPEKVELIIDYDYKATLN